MKILILGDVGASQYNLQAFCNAEKDLFSSEIQDMCASADIVLLNLEKPLINEKNPLRKCPPDYFAPIETINGINLLSPTAVTLANNHILDQQEQGLRSTITVLEQNQIQYVGAGENLQEARKPIIITKEGTKVGIYACCEKEFSFATESSPGANMFDPLVTFDDIEELRVLCDYLIILFHGGMQGFPYPTPYQQRVCRQMCKKGADLVVCQHSHIIGCEEKYSDATIVYGQGNFLLDDVADVNWHSGLAIEIFIGTENKKIKYIPVQTQNHKVVIHPENNKVMEGFQKRSREAANSQMVEKRFCELSNQKISNYLVKLSGKGQLLQKIFRRIGLTKHYERLYSKDACNMMLDYFYCDSHREAIEYGLNQCVSKKEKRK